MGLGGPKCSRLLRSVVLALSLFSLPVLSGCELRTFYIQLPGYGNGTIQGLWLWKQVSGRWTRVCRIDFTDRRITEQGETLFYAQNCVDGKVKRGIGLSSPIARGRTDAATITVELVYLRYEDAGSYRATAFNAYGESPLSSSSLPL